MTIQVTNPASRPIFDFDDIGAWGPRLRLFLAPVLPADVEEQIKRAKPAFYEDARNVLCEAAEPDALALLIQRWLCSHTVVAYHGSRLTPEEMQSIRDHGLKLLKLADRAPRLKRVLSQHPRWSEVSDRLPALIHRHGEGWRTGGVGRREGTAHACPSLAGLLQGCNHYFAGAEVDQNVAGELLGVEEGRALLLTWGDPVLVTLAVPGEAAIAAANPFGMPESGFPNLVREIVTVFSYWLANSTYGPRNDADSFALWFEAAVPPEWISAIRIVSPDELTD